MNRIVLVAFVLVGAWAKWPPAPPDPEPFVGIDFLGGDLPNMPVSLSSDNYTLCADLCTATTGCRAWTYSPPGCDHLKPSCYLKFIYPHQSAPNQCRISGILTSRPCQLTTPWTSDVDPNNPPHSDLHPRPQFARGDDSWTPLNGLWEFQFGSASDQPPFGQTLDSQILVPFPAESCLSGIGWPKSAYMWYRLVFDIESKFTLPKFLLHFGSVDWQTTVYVNKNKVGQHVGGYDPFTFDVTNYLTPKDNEVIVGVYDPSNYGQQPFGKQRLDATIYPGGDTYWPVSGIWQTVWLENVPASFVHHVTITPTLKSVTVNVTASSSLPVTIYVLASAHLVANATGTAGTPITVTIADDDILLWTPNDPFLYDLHIQYGTDDYIYSYFGLRTFTLGQDDNNVTRPLLNGEFQFLAGWLDQSWWPDGLYTAPTDDALRFDLEAVKTYGFNFVRLHQKVNPQRWYYYADLLGVVVQQDAVQHYGDGVSVPDSSFYFHDLTAMINNVYNHPCIVIWTAFNEWDMVTHFNVTQVVDYIAALDPSRLVDTDSGGPANDLHIGNINDIHTYPDPGDPKPSATQYAQIGEYGGLGAYVDGHMWVEGACQAYRECASTDDFANQYIKMTQTILSQKSDISVVVYTQITDVERECDGFYNFDRTNKLQGTTLQKVVQANQKLIYG